MGRGAAVSSGRLPAMACTRRRWASCNRRACPVLSALGRLLMDSRETVQGSRPGESSRARCVKYARSISVPGAATASLHSHRSRASWPGTGMTRWGDADRNSSRRRSRSVDLARVSWKMSARDCSTASALGRSAAYLLGEAHSGGIPARVAYFRPERLFFHEVRGIRIHHCPVDFTKGPNRSRRRHRYPPGPCPWRAVP